MGAEFSVEHPATADPANQSHSESSRYVTRGKPSRTNNVLTELTLAVLRTNIITIAMKSVRARLHDASRPELTSSDRPVIQDLMTWGTSLSSCERSCFSFESSTLPASGIISQDSILWIEWRNMPLQGMKRDTIPAEGAGTRATPSSPISMRVL